MYIINMPLKVGDICTLRNGLKTSPLRKSNNGTNYIFDADVQEPEHKTKSILSWKANGRFLTNTTDHRLDIVINF